MATPVVKNLEKKNAEYAASFTQGHLPLPPGKGYLVLTCMDARIDPASAFGIALGDAHVVRNAGASAREALRSILVSQQLLGTQEVLVIKHTGCGMMIFSNDDAHGLVAKKLGPTAAAEIATLDFQTFGDVEKAVRDDVDFLNKQAAVPAEVKISGWVYEVETGKVRRVV